MKYILIVRLTSSVSSVSLRSFILAQFKRVKKGTDWRFGDIRVLVQNVSGFLHEQ